VKTIIALLCCFGALAAAQEPQPIDPAPISPAPSPAPVQEKSQSAAPSGQSNAQPRAPKAGTRADRLDLDTTVVTGNRELPKVLYIVPWKKPEIGDLPAQPFNTLLDEVLAPVDRDVFKREVTYFHTVTQGDKAVAPNVGEEK
jgi:hypothetical protein